MGSTRKIKGKHGVITHHLEAFMERLAWWAFSRPVPALGIGAALTVLGLILASQLKIDADLSQLLPRSFPSVQAMNKLEERFGAIGSVTVVGMSRDPEALKAFAEDMAPRLEALPSVDYVEWTRSTGFFQDRALYFLELTDLQEIADRIRDRVKWEQRKHNPMYVDLEDLPPPPLDFDDIEQRYAGRSDRDWLQRQQARHYYMDEAAGIIILMAKPVSQAVDLAFSKKVVTEVEDLVAGQDFTRFAQDFQVQLTGRYKRRVDLQDTISHDLVLASTLAMVLILAYLLVHFRRIGALILVVPPLLAGLIWMFGAAWALFGTLNIITGFVGAILLGLGIDHGIHLMGSYEREFELHGKETALRRAFGSTGRAVVIAAATTAFAFLGIAFSEFRAFLEFGVISALGMVSIVIAYTILLPAGLALFHRFGWTPRRFTGGSKTIWPAIVGRHGGLIFWTSLAVVLLLAFHGREARFNYSFAALETSHLPSFTLDEATNRLIGFSETPLVVLTDKAGEEQAVADRIREVMLDHGEESTIDMVATVSDLVPGDQAAKKEILEQLSKTLRRIKPTWLKPETRETFLRMKRMAGMEPFSREDLPLELRRQFENPKLKDAGGFVLVFPGIDLTNGSETRRMAKEMRDITMPDGAPVLVAGEGMILADILEMIWKEGPPTMAVTLALVFVLMWLLLGSLVSAVVCFLSAALSIAATLGLLAFTGVELNYLNLIFILVLFGTGVDAAVHLVSGAREGGSLASLVEQTGRGVSGAILTTMLGFGTLLLADHSGLNSVGHLALMGQCANLLVSLVILVGFLSTRAGRFFFKELEK